MGKSCSECLRELLTPACSSDKEVTPETKCGGCNTYKRFMEEHKPAELLDEDELF